MPENTKKATNKKSTKKATPSKTTTKKSMLKEDIVKKSSTKKSLTKKTSSKSSTARKSVASKSSPNSTASKGSQGTKARKSKKIELVEYYDLPYRYNQTIVKILAQTPNTLFVYWDISDSDRQKYINQFGENFFEETTPVLIVHNKTMNYSFEIEINDFANSWYFNVDNAKCDYEIELGRRAKSSSVELPNNYLRVTNSNVVESPNNHILFEKKQNTIFFRNVKTNQTVSKSTSQFEFMKYAGRIYNVYDLYKKIYKNEELQNLDKMSSSSF